MTGRDHGHGDRRLEAGPRPRARLRFRSDAVLNEGKLWTARQATVHAELIIRSDYSLAIA